MQSGWSEEIGRNHCGVPPLKFMTIITFIIILLSILALAFIGFVAFIIGMKEDSGWAYIAGVVCLIICGLSVWKLFPYIEKFQ
jgi:hypothetical protein